ncbi:MAG: hypothetical protein RLZZ360_734 [Candidatus Parcubacteria bacterium]|jgi:hypothetical protein
MKKVLLFSLLVVCVIGLTGTPAHAATAATVVRINETYTLFGIPFSLTSNKRTVVVPTTAQRDTATASSLGYTLKTPEGLRQSDGLSVGMVVAGEKAGSYMLYVLYKDTVPSARVSTLAISHLPFLLIDAKTGTSSQQLNRSELRRYSVTNKTVPPLSTAE